MFTITNSSKSNIVGFTYMKHNFHKRNEYMYNEAYLLMIRRILNHYLVK